MTENKKTIKKSLYNNKITSRGGVDDIVRLKKIARKIMEHIEQVIEQYDAADKRNENNENSKNSWLFSGRTSLVATLITLTDLLIKLEASCPQEQQGSKSDELEHLPLSKPDKKLLRQFIEKRQHSTPDSK